MIAGSSRSSILKILGDDDFSAGQLDNAAGGGYAATSSPTETKGVKMLLYTKPAHDYIITTRGDRFRVMTTNSVVLRRLAPLVGLRVIEVEW